MEAMVLEAPRTALKRMERPIPRPGPGQVLVKVGACGVCRTDLHILDGELEHPALPLVPGHEIVGRVVTAGPGVTGLVPGQRVGIPWLAGTCQTCAPCRSGRENLCDRAVFTGYDLDGGFAEYTVANARFAFPMPERDTDAADAPFLCAGLIGHRAYRMAGDAPRLGIYGFGAAAHIITQVAVQEGRTVFAFTRPGDTESQAFALSLGAAWAGDSTQPAPALDAAIIFAPAGPLVPLALAAVAKGGTVVCAGIHMSDIPAFPYALLWGERVLRSVANLTRQDGLDFFSTIGHLDIRTTVTTFPLREANLALDRLRAGALQGAAVLVP
ncbi:MAG: zinc-dependent alcohol dehydrogenase family protein [Holophaga sp.]|nr:zinc-dependent alcohol dehydrogenase family protein [Holophaga sp.]